MKGGKDTTQNIRDNILSQQPYEKNILPQENSIINVPIYNKQIEHEQPKIDMDYLTTNYPNHITYNKGDKLYVTPTLIGMLDLEYASLSEPQFDKIFGLLQKRLEGTTHKIDTQSKETFYSKYMSIINEPETNMDIIFIINMYLLIIYNKASPLVSHSFWFYGNDIPNKKGDQRGGIKQIKKIIGDAAQEITTHIDSNYYTSTGGRDIVSYLLGILEIYTSLEALNYFLGIGLDHATLFVASLFIQVISVRDIRNGVSGTLTSFNTIMRRSGYEVMSGDIIRRTNNVVMSSSIIVETLRDNIAQFNLYISEPISQTLRTEFARHSSNRYLNTTAFRPIPYETISQNIIRFQTAQGYLTNGSPFVTEQEETIEEPLAPINITDEQLRGFIIAVPQPDGTYVAGFNQEGLDALRPLNKGQRTIIERKVRSLFNGQTLPENLNMSKIVRLSNAFTTLLGEAVQNPSRVIRKYKEITCPVCSQLFCYDREFGYICEKFTDTRVEEIKESEFNLWETKEKSLIRARVRTERIDANLPVPDEDTEVRMPEMEAEVTRRMNLPENAMKSTAMRNSINDTYTERVVQEICKLNTFPCQQVIMSLSPDKRDAPEFLLNERFGEDNNGTELRCSNCSLREILETTSDANDFFVGVGINKISIPLSLIIELIQYLTPYEMKQICSIYYTKKQLDATPIKQKLQDEKLLQEEIQNIIRNRQPLQVGNTVATQEEENKARDSLTDTITCPTCNISDIKRFKRKFKRSDLEILSLRCNNCSRKFNGCDMERPYLLTKEQFKEFISLPQQSKNVCNFLRDIKLRETRNNAEVLLTLELFIISEQNRIDKNAMLLSKQRCPSNHGLDNYGNEIPLYSECGSACNHMQCNVSNIPGTPAIGCGAHYCYICGDVISGNAPGDHFLGSLNSPNRDLMTPPYSGLFGLQCNNCNWAIIDPDGNPGPHAGATEGGIAILPRDPLYVNDRERNPNNCSAEKLTYYKLRTRSIWKKWLFLKNEVQNTLPNASDDTIVTRLKQGGNNLWHSMDKLGYNIDKDEVYRYDDPTDPRLDANITRSYPDYVRGYNERNPTIVPQQQPIAPQEHPVVDVPGPNNEAVLTQPIDRRVPGPNPLVNRNADALDDEAFQEMLLQMPPEDDELQLQIAMAESLQQNNVPMNPVNHQLIDELIALQLNNAFSGLTEQEQIDRIIGVARAEPPRNSPFGTQNRFQQNVYDNGLTRQEQLDRQNGVARAAPRQPPQVTADALMAQRLQDEFDNIRGETGMTHRRPQQSRNNGENFSPGVRRSNSRRPSGRYSLNDFLSSDDESDINDLSSTRDQLTVNETISQNNIRNPNNPFRWPQTNNRGPVSFLQPLSTLEQEYNTQHLNEQQRANTQRQTKCDEIIRLLNYHRRELGMDNPLRDIEIEQINAAISHITELKNSNTDLPFDASTHLRELKILIDANKFIKLFHGVIIDRDRNDRTRTAEFTHLCYIIPQGRTTPVATLRMDDNEGNILGYYPYVWNNTPFQFIVPPPFITPDNRHPIRCIQINNIKELILKYNRSSNLREDLLYTYGIGLLTHYGEHIRNLYTHWDRINAHIGGATKRRRTIKISKKKYKTIKNKKQLKTKNNKRKTIKHYKKKKHNTQYK